MNISLQNIRRLGYLKINQSIDLDTCINLIVKYNTEFYDTKVSSFSLPKKWKNIPQSVKDKIKGIRDFMLSCDAMMENITPDDFIQRRFRNRYHRLWEEYGQMMNIQVSQAIILEEFGLKLIYVMDKLQESELTLILAFYNAIIEWYLMTQTDTSLSEYDLSCLDILTLLTIKTPDDFIQYVMRGV